jgi:hypothetical protein
LLHKPNVAGKIGHRSHGGKNLVDSELSPDGRGTHQVHPAIDNDFTGQIVHAFRVDYIISNNGPHEQIVRIRAVDKLKAFICADLDHILSRMSKNAPLIIKKKHVPVTRNFLRLKRSSKLIQGNVDAKYSTADAKLFGTGDAWKLCLAENIRFGEKNGLLLQGTLVSCPGARVVFRVNCAITTDVSAFLVKKKPVLTRRTGIVAKNRSHDIESPCRSLIQTSEINLIANRYDL